MALESKFSAAKPLGDVVERDRKFLVVVDDSPESAAALRFASGRAAHVEGGGVILFHAIPPGDFQHWLSVAERMKEEAREQAHQTLSRLAAKVFAFCGVEPELVIVEGQPEEALRDFIDSREDIFALILGAAPSGEPGALVDHFASTIAGDLPCIVVVVPGRLSADEIEDLV